MEPTDYEYPEYEIFICCPYCLATIAGDETICPQCENDITNDALVEYNESEFWNAEKKICPKCQKKIMNIAVICPVCKTKQ